MSIDHTRLLETDDFNIYYTRKENGDQCITLIAYRENISYEVPIYTFIQLVSMALEQFVSGDN